MLRKITLLALALAMLAGPAGAAVLYQFVPTSYSSGWSFDGPFASLSFELDNKAADKARFSAQQLQFPYFLTGDPGLKSISAVAPRLDDLLGPNGGDFQMAVTLGPHGNITSAAFNFFNDFQTENFVLTSSGGHISAYFTTDDQADPCYVQGACTISGHWRKGRIAIPEPPSLLLAASAFCIGIGTTRRLRRQLCSSAT